MFDIPVIPYVQNVAYIELPLNGDNITKASIPYLRRTTANLNVYCKYWYKWLDLSCFV